MELSVDHEKSRKQFWIEHIQSAIHELKGNKRYSRTIPENNMRNK